MVPYPHNPRDQLYPRDVMSWKARRMSEAGDTSALVVGIVAPAGGGKSTFVQVRTPPENTHDRKCITITYQV